MERFNILYVDDEISNLQGFKSIYFTQYNVITAVSGREALEILDEQEVHIIITDQKMPEMTGVEFLNNVVVKYPDPIRIILTGYSDIEVIIQAINGSGIYRYLTKPWDVKEMDMILEQGIETFELRRQNRQLVEDLKVANESLEWKIKERTEEVVSKKAEIERKNEKITSSINYAKRIQDAMLSTINDVKPHLDDIFVLFKPKDIVSGDFYWCYEHYGKIIIAAIDCTGHGIPGAFMSMVGAQALSNIVKVKHIYEPDLILNELRNEVRNLLKQDSGDNKDGMDAAICMIDTDRSILNFAGAKRPLLYIQNEELVHIKGDKKSIGGVQKQDDSPFTNHQILVDEPTVCYLFSDGYQDQFGGSEGKKFMVKGLKSLIQNLHDKPMHEQHELFDQTITEWMSGVKQLDDILLMGFKI